MSKIIDKLAWLFIREGKLLCARSKDKALFYIPGGKREVGESDQEALIREIKEEISVDLIPDSITYAQTFCAQADGKDNTQVQLTCYFADYQGELMPDAEIAEIDFLSFEHKQRSSLGSIKAFEWLKDEALID